MAPHDAALLRQWTQKRDAAAFRQLAERYAGLVYATAVRILHDTAAAEDVAQDVFLKLAQQHSVDRSLPAWLHRVTTNACLDALKSNTRRQKRESEWSMNQRAITPDGDNVPNVPHLQRAANTPNPQHATEARNTEHVMRRPNAEHSAHTPDTEHATNTPKPERAATPPHTESATNPLDPERRANNQAAERATNAPESALHATDLEWNDIRPHLDAAIEELPEPQRAVIIGHFLHGQTHGELARALGISRPAVTQRIARALDQLRERLKQRGITIAAAPLAAMLASNTSMAAPATLLIAIGKTALATQVTSATGATAALASGGIASYLTAKFLVALLAIGAIGGFFALLYDVRRDATDSANLGGDAIQQASPSAPPAQANPQPTTVQVDSEEAATLSTVQQANDVPANNAMTGMIRGRVYDTKTGRGLDDALVKYEYIRGGPHEGEHGHVATGANGNYTIENLRHGVYTISVDVDRHAGFQNHDFIGGLRQQVAIVPDELIHDVDLTFSSGIYVSGRVVDPSGNGLEGLFVVGHGDSLPQHTISRENGAFTLKGFQEPGDLSLASSSEERLLSGNLRVDLPPEGLSGVVIKLQPKAWVEGVVLDRHYNPLPGVEIRLEQGGEGELKAGARSQDAGAFRIGAVDPGAYELVAKLDETEVARMPLDVPSPDRFSGIQVVVNSSSKGLSISGRVTDPSGRPVEDAWVLGRTVSSAMGTSDDRTDPDGHYTLSGLANDAYSITAHGSGFSNAQITAAPGTTNADIALTELAAVEGRVVDAETLSPLPEFRVAFTGGEHNGWLPDTFNGGELFYDKSGEFRLENVNAGPGTVVATADGYAIGGKYFETLAPGQTTSGAEIQLSREAIVKGRVVLASGAPVADAGIYLGEPPHQAYLPDPIVTTDADGGFELSLRAELQRISTYHPDHGKGAIDVTPRAGESIEADIVITAGAVEGVVRLNGHEVPANLVLLPTSGGLFQGAESEDDGTFALMGIAPGDYALVANVRRPDQATLTKEKQITVVADATTHVTYDFYGNAEIAGVVDLSGMAFDYVSISASSPAANVSANTSLEADGSFALTDLPPGEWRVQLGAGMQDGGTPVTRFEHVQVAEGERAWVEFSLTGGGALTGSVSGLAQGDQASILIFTADADLEPFLNAPLDPVAGEALNKCCLVSAAHVAPEQTMRFDFASLAPGDYQVFVTHIRRSTQNGGIEMRVAGHQLERVSITDGATQHLQIDF